MSLRLIFNPVTLLLSLLFPKKMALLQSNLVYSSHFHPCWFRSRRQPRLSVAGSPAPRLRPTAVSVVAAVGAPGNKPSVCTADELHRVAVADSDWSLALWRYIPPPKVLSLSLSLDLYLCFRLCICEYKPGVVEWMHHRRRRGIIRCCCCPASEPMLLDSILLLRSVLCSSLNILVYIFYFHILVVFWRMGAFVDALWFYSLIYIWTKHSKQSYRQLRYPIV